MVYPRPSHMKSSACSTGVLLESLECRQLLSATLEDGVLSIIGTPGDDVVNLARPSKDSPRLAVNVNGVKARFDLASITRVEIRLLGGNDVFRTNELNGAIAMPLQVRGGLGNDSIYGASGDDTLLGGMGEDLLVGRAGNDLIRGGFSNDRLLGEDGDDSLRGGAGDDMINGGAGTNSVLGGAGNNTIDSGAAVTYQPMYRVSPFAGYGQTQVVNQVSGLTPTQVRGAYEFGDLTNAQFTNRGAGQTIYIVDAFTGRDVWSDLAVFSAEFGLPAPTAANFQIVNAGGGTPAIDADWANEINLDVQWAHAIAPEAKIVLVQADSNMDIDLLPAVRLAARMSEASGGGVVSLSLGAYGDFARPDWDAVFQSAANTSFVVAAGDAAGVFGSPGNSPYVLSVGGTLLSVDDRGNHVGQEVASDEMSGGVSFAYAKPDYQSGLPYAGRAIPDVAYNADGESGMAVYTSTALDGVAGWLPGGMGGTSAGAPQWAGLIALANQLRVQNGGNVIGNRITPTIYQIAQDAYSLTFRDITAGAIGEQTAEAGFDLSTGLGVPRASNLINYLSGTEARYLSTQFTWNAQLIQATQTNFDGTTTTPLPIALGGTGMAVGGDRISLSFTGIVNRWDTTGTIATITANDLYRSADNRVYGIGIVEFNNGFAGGPLRFDGSVYVGSDGREHLKVKFWAVDGNGDPWPTSPFKLQQLQEQDGMIRISFRGTLKG